MPDANSVRYDPRTHHVFVAGEKQLAVIDAKTLERFDGHQAASAPARFSDCFVALHNHMSGKQPTFYFTHFWGKGPAQELANGVRSALDCLRVAVKQQPAANHGTNSKWRK